MFILPKFNYLWIRNNQQLPGQYNMTHVFRHLKYHHQCHWSIFISITYECTFDPIINPYRKVKNVHKNVVRTSQRTHYVSATMINRLMLFRKKTLITVRTTWKIQRHCLGGMYSFSLLKQVVCMITTGIYRLKIFFKTLITISN
jgi:hypothetical protein